MSQPGDTLRMLAAAAALVYVISGGFTVGPVSRRAYSGGMSAVHDAAASMAAKDRAALAEAMEAAGEMLAADRLGLVSTTEDLQRYVQAVTEFDYLGLDKPTQKYPAVAAAIQAELTKAVGTDVAKLTPAMRAAASAALTEAGKAVR